MRARIVLTCAQDEDKKAIADELRWQSIPSGGGKFISKRLKGLADEALPGRPPSESASRSDRAANRLPSCCRGTVICTRMIGSARAVMLEALESALHTGSTATGAPP